MKNKQADFRMYMKMQRATPNKDSLESGNKVRVLILLD